MILLLAITITLTFLQDKEILGFKIMNYINNGPGFPTAQIEA